MNKFIILAISITLLSGCARLSQILKSRTDKHESVPEPQLAEKYRQHKQEKPKPITREEKEKSLLDEPLLNPTEQAYINRYKQKVKEDRRKDSQRVFGVFAPKDEK